MKQKITEIANKLAKVRHWAHIPEETCSEINEVLDMLSGLENSPATCIQFNPYPATTPPENCNYIVLFDNGLTDSYWWDGEEWVYNEHSIEPIEGVVGWAEFPEVNEVPKMKYYVLFVWNDIEPELIGPFDTEEERNRAALEKREAEGDSHGYFMLNSPARVEISPYGGGFFNIK